MSKKSKKKRPADPTSADAPQKKRAAESTAENAPQKKKPKLSWDADAEVPKWAPRPANVKLVPPGTAVALELENAKAMRKLRSLLEERAPKVPESTFESWRLAAKQEEDEAAAAKKKSKPSHPALPGGPTPAADGALVRELQQQGVAPDVAATAARTLSEAAARLSAELLKRAHAAASGKAPAAPPLEVSFNRHTVDLASGKTKLKLSRAAYGKLAVLHRRHAPPGEASAAPAKGGEEGGEDDEAAAAAAAAGAEGGAAAGAAGDARAALHLRLFAMGLRHKALHADGRKRPPTAAPVVPNTARGCTVAARLAPGRSLHSRGPTEPVGVLTAATGPP